MAGPFKGAPLSLVAITPALAGPYDYGVVVVRVARQRRPPRRPRHRGLRHRAVDHRRHPAADPLDPGQPDQAQLHPQPDQLLPDGSRLAREWATRERSPTSPPTSKPPTARRLPFKPQMAVKYLSGGKARAKNPSISFDAARPAPATPTSNRSRSPSPRPLRSTSATSATSAQRPNWSRPSAREEPAIGNGGDQHPAARPATGRSRLRGLGQRRAADDWPSSSTARCHWSPGPSPPRSTRAP